MSSPFFDTFTCLCPRIRFLYVSRDAGGNYSRPGLTAQFWSSVACSANGSYAVAVTDSGAVFRSTDSGITWAFVSSSSAWVTMAMSADGMVVVGANAVSLAVSTNGGTLIWIPSYLGQDVGGGAGLGCNQRLTINRPPNTNSVHRDGDRASISLFTAGITFVTRISLGPFPYATYYWRSVAISSDGQTILAGQSNFNSLAQSYLYLSRDGGLTFTNVTYPHGRYWISTTVSGSGTKMAAIAQDGRYFVSLDQGFTWSNKTTTPIYGIIQYTRDGSKVSQRVT